MAAYKITKVAPINKTFHLRETTALLKWVLQIFSLDTAEKRTNKSDKCWYLIKCLLSVAIVGAIDVYSLIWKIQHIFSSVNPSIVWTDIIQMSYDYSQYIVDLFFIYKYGREMSQEYFKNYECIDKIIDNTHYAKIKNRILKLIVFILMCWIVTSLIDFTAWYVGYGIMTPLWYSLAYVFLLIKIFTILDLTLQIMNIECRLRALVDLLQNAYNAADNLPAVNNDIITDFINNKNWFYKKGCNLTLEVRSRNHVMKNKSQQAHEVNWLSRCYLLLNEQCTFINSMFGIRILLNSLSLLIDMVRFLNVVVRISVGSQKTMYDASYIPAVSTMLRFGLCVVILTSLVYHAERVYAQTDRLVSVADHILVNKNPDIPLRASVSDLRALVISRPISFNMANFFTLSYPFLISMASVVVTYTIILLQSL